LVALLTATNVASATTTVYCKGERFDLMAHANTSTGEIGDMTLYSYTKAVLTLVGGDIEIGKVDWENETLEIRSKQTAGNDAIFRVETRDDVVHLKWGTESDELECDWDF
jgi:hypothetical protein